MGEAELGVGWRRFAERIDVGLDVPEGAVGCDEVVDVRLLQAVDDRDAGGSGQRAAAIAEGETLEKCALRRVHRVGIGLPSLVGRLDDGRIGMVGERKAAHG